MHDLGPSDHEMTVALERVQRAVRTAFCGVMHSTHLPPLAALNLAAIAVGTLYREVAGAHCANGPCPCGWLPAGAADVETLQKALALAARPSADLLTVAVAGNA